MQTIKNTNPVFTLDYVYETSELSNYYVKDINKILKNRNIWKEYNREHPNTKTLSDKIKFIISNQGMTKNGHATFFIPSSTDILGVIISNDVKMFAKMNALSKTLDFIKESRISHKVLENVVGNGFRCDVNFPCVLAAYLCVTIHQPNYLSQISKNPYFITHCPLIMDVLRHLGVELMGVNGLFQKNMKTGVHFCAPGTSIDLHYQIYPYAYTSVDKTHSEQLSKIWDQYHADNRNKTTNGLVHILLETMRDYPLIIACPMFCSSIIDNNKNKNVHILYDLFQNDDCARIALIKHRDPTFYIALGEYITICADIISMLEKSKISTTSTKPRTDALSAPNMFVLSLGDHQSLLYRFVQYIHRTKKEKGIKDTVNICATYGSPKLAEKVRGIRSFAS